ncbi:blue copper protein-like [Lycium ferocissimum]|uniref:blue copper protein-like n=1 Tax=Lycium ferocissimum TaxID=112874 RepID=UPI0028159A10|nr:blue copper protein-like [Lycium ferocissimum]
MTFFRKAMLVVMMAVLGSTNAAVYQVGDSNFQVGDTVVFNYNPQLHNVRQVDINDYNSCTDNNPIASYNSGSDSVTLETAGEYYFLSGVPRDCAAGLKFHLNIAAATTTTPTTPVTPSTPTTPTTMNTPYPDHFPSSPINKPNETLKHHPFASVAYSSKWFPMSMLLPYFLLAMV